MSNDTQIFASQDLFSSSKCFFNIFYIFALFSAFAIIKILQNITCYYATSLLQLFSTKFVKYPPFHLLVVGVGPGSGGGGALLGRLERAHSGVAGGQVRQAAAGPQNGQPAQLQATPSAHKSIRLCLRLKAI